MKARIIITLIVFLGLGNTVQAHSGLFRPAFNRTLKRIDNLKPGYLQQHLAKQKNKQTVFVDLRKIYWGDLETFNEDNQDMIVFEQIVSELKEGLVAYARHYNVRVRLDNKSYRPNVTKHFLNWLDQFEDIRSGQTGS